MPDWLQYASMGALLAWALSFEVRFWRTYRAIMILDTIIKAFTRYAHERGSDADS